VTVTCDLKTGVNDLRGPSEDKKWRTHWTPEYCNMKQVTGICRIPLTSCKKASFKCNADWKETCGVLTHYIEERSAWINKDVAEKLDSLRRDTVLVSGQGDKNTFLKHQKLGMQKPTLLVFEDINNSALTDKQKRDKNHNLIYTNLEEKAFIEKYLKDIRAGLYGQAEKAAAELHGDYRVHSLATRPSQIGFANTPCNCACEQWNDFKKNQGVGSKIYTDTANYDSPDPKSMTEFNSVATLTCKNHRNSADRKDVGYCFRNEVTAKCDWQFQTSDPAGMREYRMRWSWGNVVPASSLCENNCCTTSQPFGDVTTNGLYENIANLPPVSGMADYFERDPQFEGKIIQGDEFTFKCKPGTIMANGKTQITHKATFKPTGSKSFFGSPDKSCWPSVKCSAKKCQTCPALSNGYCYYDERRALTSNRVSDFAIDETCRCRCNRCFMMAKNT
jgi:hypothetical protein